MAFYGAWVRRGYVEITKSRLCGIQVGLGLMCNNLTYENKNLFHLSAISSWKYRMKRLHMLLQKKINVFNIACKPLEIFPSKAAENWDRRSCLIFNANVGIQLNFLLCFTNSWRVSHKSGVNRRTKCIESFFLPSFTFFHFSIFSPSVSQSSWVPFNVSHSNYLFRQ